MKAFARRETVHGLVWISPWLIGFLLFMAIPVAMSFRYSLSDYSMLEAPVFIGLENYLEILRDDLVWISIRNTAIYAAATVVLGTVLAIALATLLDQPIPIRGAVRAIVFLPTLVPIVAAALGWMWLYNGESGLINTMLGWVGIRGPDWLGDAGWAMAALVLMSLWQVGGAVVIYLAALQDVPRSLYEAASLDGMGPMRRFFAVTVPMISPAILFNVVMAIIWSIQVFAVPHVMTRGGPENATTFYTMQVYANGFVYLRMGYASALAWIQLIAILLVTGLMFLLSRRFVHYRGG